MHLRRYGSLICSLEFLRNICCYHKFYYFLDEFIENIYLWLRLVVEELVNHIFSTIGLTHLWHIAFSLYHLISNECTEQFVACIKIDLIWILNLCRLGAHTSKDCPEQRAQSMRRCILSCEC
ncbi:hypothetical protein ACJX0J_028911, partial [Zea mays]